MARDRRHKGYQLIGQAVQHGAARLAVRGLAVPVLTPAGQIGSDLARRLVLAAAACTAMVFAWSKLTDGEPNVTLTQLWVHDTIMVLAREPIVGLLLGLPSISITMPRKTRFLSVALCLVVPVITARSWRRSLLASGVGAALAGRLRRLQPLSLLALSAPLVRRFGFEGAQIVSQPLVIVRLTDACDHHPGPPARGYRVLAELGAWRAACPSALIWGVEFAAAAANAFPVSVRPVVGHRRRRARRGRGEAVGGAHRAHRAGAAPGISGCRCTPRRPARRIWRSADG